MGRIIRRTVTITITETWTIVWTDNIRADDTSPPQATTIVQEQRKTKEQPDETIQITLGDTDPGDPSASDPTASPTPDGASPAPSRQRKRTRQRSTG